MKRDSTVPAYPKRRSRTIYLLPNLFTTSALLSGFYSIIAAYNGAYKVAAIAIIVSMVLDGFDGRVARMTNTATPFGAEYDSMADMVSFGVAPAFLVYTWSLSGVDQATFGQLGWMLAFVHAACCGLRLARFNVAVGTADKRFFQGLASPAAAAILAGMVWVAENRGFVGTDMRTFVGIATVTTGLLMVSNLTYYSFKDIGGIKRVPFAMLAVFVLLLAVTAVDPAMMILLGFSAYAASGPVWYGWHLLRKRRRQAGQPDDDVASADSVREGRGAQEKPVGTGQREKGGQ
ncbi:MAG: CDP-diacylglycerol--serine O-phosphatidyltransferase [Gammaproteobacteria bacterium]|nr:MAG: CDP-diacylglycerol--serine O-phosphatidyltransferase [Gammaproteobacteria bacterium]PIE37387.1 MAG: CDP-diacylglycerol--serine O-phosphatidyltransferase [Gammaproteobacteria bacterium]